MISFWKPILLIFFSFAYFQDYIYPGVFGDELSELIKNDYSTSSTLGYNAARDTMYLIIDSDDNLVSCIYSDFTVELIPNSDPSTTMYLGGINCDT